MLVDCALLPSGTVIEADVCIVGAGPAGCAVARSLEGSGLRVALLDTGGRPGRPLGLRDEWVTHGTGSMPAAPRVPPRFGGGGNEWIVRLPWMRRGVRMVPLLPLDLERREWIPDSGWPIGWDELRPWYQAAFTRLELGEFEEPACGSDASWHERWPFERFGFTTAMERFPESATLTAADWSVLTRSSSVTVYLHAPVGALEGTRDRVTCAEIDHGSRARLQVHAQRFVVAAGGLENARLLLASRGGAGYGNGNDLLGRYYMDHHRVTTGSITPSTASVFDRLQLYDFRWFGAWGAMGKVVPTAALMGQHQLLQSAAMLLPKPPASTRDAVRRVRSDPRSIARRDLAAPLVSALRYYGGAGLEMALRQRRFPPHVDAGWSALRSKGRRFATLQVEHQIELAPVRSNRVALGPTVDAYGRRKAHLEWRWTELDLESLRRTQDVFGRAVEASGLGRFEPTTWDEAPPLNTPAGAYHPSGCTRMHADARHGVVDPNGRVHECANLFVTGSSVFPTVGYANPTLTILALALRLGQHLSSG